MQRYGEAVKRYWRINILSFFMCFFKNKYKEVDTLDNECLYDTNRDRPTILLVIFKNVNPYCQQKRCRNNIIMSLFFNIYYDIYIKVLGWCHRQENIWVNHSDQVNFKIKFLQIVENIIIKMSSIKIDAFWMYWEIDLPGDWDMYTMYGVHSAHKYHASINQSSIERCIYFAPFIFVI